MSGFGRIVCSASLRSTRRRTARSARRALPILKTPLASRPVLAQRPAKAATRWIRYAAPARSAATARSSGNAKTTAADSALPHTAEAAALTTRIAISTGGENQEKNQGRLNRGKPLLPSCAMLSVSVSAGPASLRSASTRVSKRPSPVATSASTLVPIPQHVKTSTAWLSSGVSVASCRKTGRDTTTQLTTCRLHPGSSLCYH